MKTPIKLFIADSNELIRVGLRCVFNEVEEVEIVGAAGCSTDLLRQLNEQEVDVVLIDFTAPGFDIETIPAMLSKHRNLRCVAITPIQSGYIIASALRAGVMSYVKKDCSLTEIIDAVKSVAAGSKFFCGQVLDAVRQESIDPDEIVAGGGISCDPLQLSDREQEVITLIAEGYTNAKIADKLFLSLHTVNTHRKNIMQKLGVNNTAAIVMFCVKNQLVSSNKFLFTVPPQESVS